MVAATAARELREKTSVQWSMRASRSAGATISVAKPCSRAQAASRSLAAQQQLARGGLAEHLGQQQRAGVARDEADADLGREQPDAVGAQAQVAARGELERAADAHAVDRRDRRHGAGEHHARQALEAPRSWPPRRSRRPRSRPAGRRRPRSGRPRRAGRRSAPPGRRPPPRSRRRSRSSCPRSQALRRSWRSQLTSRAAPWSAVVTVIGRPPLLRFSTAGGSASPRAVRWTMRVLCSATGSEPGSSRVTREARAQGVAEPCGHARRARPPEPPRRRRRAAARSGRPSATTQWRPRRASAASSAPIACG